MHWDTETSISGASSDSRCALISSAAVCPFSGPEMSLSLANQRSSKTLTTRQALFWLALARRVAVPPPRRGRLRMARCRGWRTSLSSRGEPFGLETDPKRGRHCWAISGVPSDGRSVLWSPVVRLRKRGSRVRSAMRRWHWECGSRGDPGHGRDSSNEVRRSGRATPPTLSIPTASWISAAPRDLPPVLHHRARRPLVGRGGSAHRRGNHALQTRTRELAGISLPPRSVRATPRLILQARPSTPNRRLHRSAHPTFRKPALRTPSCWRRRN